MNTLKRRENKMVSKIEKALNSTLDGDKLTSKFMRNFVEDNKSKSGDKHKMELRPQPNQEYVKRFEILDGSEMKTAVSLSKVLNETISPNFSIFLQ